MFSSTIPQGEDVCCWKRWKRVASPSHIFFLLSTPIASIPYHRIQTCVLSDKTGRLPMWGTRYLCVSLCKVFSLCMSHPNWGGLCTAADRSPAALACLKWWTQDEINRWTAELSLPLYLTSFCLSHLCIFASSSYGLVQYHSRHHLCVQKLYQQVEIL